MSKTLELITASEIETALDNARKALNYIIAHEPSNVVGSDARDAARALMRVINAPVKCVTEHIDFYIKTKHGERPWRRDGGEFMPTDGDYGLVEVLGHHGVNRWSAKLEKELNVGKTSGVIDGIKWSVEAF